MGHGTEDRCGDLSFDLVCEVWQWGDGPGSWCFLTVPAELSDEIRARRPRPPTGFGAVPVSVTIGATTWSTSLFPSKEVGSYVLPLKKAVRTAERLEPGDPATLRLRVLD